MAAQPVRVLAAVPTPPPWSGPEINGARLLTEGLDPPLELHHLRTSIGGRNEAKGRATASNAARGAALVVRAAAALVRTRPRVVYLYLSQNPTGFLRDAVIVWLARAAGARVVAHVRGANFHNFYTRTTGWRRALVAATVRQLRAVVLVADRLRPQFAGLLPAPRIFVLRNPVDPWSEPPAPVGFRMLFMGHLSHAKGFGDLLAAVPAVLDRVRDATLDAAGEWLDVETNILADEQGTPIASDAAALRREWDDLVARYPGRVRYHGVLTGAEKRAVIASSAVLVLPSYSEGLPMAVLEGMAAGLPVVATPVGAVPEIVEDRRHGRIVPPGDPRALAEALLALATDRDAAGAMGARNRAYVAAHCSPAAIRAGLSAILAEAAA